MQSELLLGQCEALGPYLAERRMLDLESRRLQNELLRKQIEHAASGNRARAR